MRACREVARFSEICFLPLTCIICPLRDHETEVIYADVKINSPLHYLALSRGFGDLIETTSQEKNAAGYTNAAGYLGLGRVVPVLSALRTR